NGELRGEVVLVPIANPIGLSQTVLHSQLGRFELASGENFNRLYPVFADWLTEPEHDIAHQLGTDAAANVAAIRAAMHAALDRHPPTTELDSLRHHLMHLACDADVVLDLHCDFEAALHFYTEPPCADTLLPLAAWMGARAVLLANGSGGRCFDEVLSGVWWQLRDKLALSHGEAFVQAHPFPQGCASVTVELRGQTDVRHDLAEADAAAIAAYLVHLGVVAGTPPALPPLACEPTPLAGTQVLTAPHAGVLTYLRQPGDDIAAGDVVAEVIHPVTGQTTPICASVNGVLYARHIVRWATTGLDVGKVSGKHPLRSGYLLSA
ncbi:MAG: succinylglutamate desuccinylase/aspartoacylase family protein, partial [Burkholderiales bacterium]|nr:succinylglutamate desuccinylase/aspartoacylase family protein [Burkholderiales bacterium]